MPTYILFGLSAILFFALGVLVNILSVFEDINIESDNSRLARNLKRDLQCIIGFTVGIIGEVLFLLITTAI